MFCKNKNAMFNRCCFNRLFRKGSPGVPPFLGKPWEIIAKKADRTMAVNGTVLNQSQVLGIHAGASIKIPPNATQAHIKLTYSEHQTMTAFVLPIKKTSNAIGFNGVSDITVPSEYFYWRPGDDADVWVTVDIDTPRANDGDRFQVNFSGAGWNDTIGCLIEIQSGAVNELPAQMPFHRAPKELLLGGAVATQSLDIPNMKFSDTGFVDDAASGTPCLKTHPSHGHTNYSINQEKGIYLGDFSHPTVALNPHSIEVDAHGRDILRLSTRKLPVPYTVNSIDFPYQASMIQAQTMPEWCHRTGIWRVQVQLPSRRGAWSAFWLLGRTLDGVNLWPPEMDIGELFNAAFGADYTPKTISSGQHVGAHGSNTREQVSGLSSELDKAGWAGTFDFHNQIHEIAGLVQDDYLYTFVDGVEIMCQRSMLGKADGSTDYLLYPVLNTAVKPPVDDPYNTGTGDLILHKMDYFALDDGWSLADFATARPYPDRRILPDPSFASDAWNSLPGIQVFEDASDPKTIKHSANEVYAWPGRDVSSNTAFQNVAGRHPTANTRTINSVAALDFNPSNQEFLDLVNPIDTSNGVSGVVVCRLDTGGTNRPLIGSSGAGGFTLRMNSSRQVQIVRTSEAVLLTGATALSTATDYIIGFRATDTSLDIFINGGPVDATAAVAPAFSAVSEYLARSVGTYWDGAIGIVGVFGGHLSDVQMDQLGNAAAAQYGLTWTNIVAAVPSSFAAGDWAIADAGTGGAADVTINSLPADGGAAITDIEFRVNAGAWISTGDVTDFTISGLTNGQSPNIQIRAVNSVGPSGASDTKSALITAPPTPVPDAFTAGDWSVATGGGDVPNATAFDHFAATASPSGTTVLSGFTTVPGLNIIAFYGGGPSQYRVGSITVNGNPTTTRFVTTSINGLNQPVMLIEYDEQGAGGAATISIGSSGTTPFRLGAGMWNLGAGYAFVAGSGVEAGTPADTAHPDPLTLTVPAQANDLLFGIAYIEDNGYTAGDTTVSGYDRKDMDDQVAGTRTLLGAVKLNTSSGNNDVSFHAGLDASGGFFGCAALWRKS